MVFEAFFVWFNHQPVMLSPAPCRQVARPGRAGDKGSWKLLWNHVKVGYKLFLNMKMEIQENFPSHLFGWQTFESLLRTKLQTHDSSRDFFRIFGVFHFWGPNFEIQDGRFLGWWVIMGFSQYHNQKTNMALQRTKETLFSRVERRSGENFVDWSWLGGRWVFI